MMIVTPALSSAPSKVKPEAVIISCPTFPRKYGSFSKVRVWLGSSGRIRSCPFQARCNRGLTPFPLQSGAVSMWEQKHRVGMPSCFDVAGMVAKTYPHSSISTSEAPKANNSFCRSLPKSFCFSEEGKEAEFGSASVSIRA